MTGEGPGGPLERFKRIDRLLDAEVEAGSFPGGVVATVTPEDAVHVHAFGRLSVEKGSGAVEPDTLYDLASLTKVVATTTLAMILVDEGFDLLERAGRFLPALRGGEKEKIRVFDLLAHSSGLPAWAPLYKTAKGRAEALEAIGAMPLEYEPGSRSIYSDLGFLALGPILEGGLKGEFGELVSERVLSPLGMGTTCYRPPKEWLPRIAPTEEDPWRGRLVHGEVHDENAFALGGVAPHAGLFGTAADLGRFARMLLGEGILEGHRMATGETFRRFTRKAGIPGSSRALGWDTPAPGSSAGSRTSPRAFGHTGFTGTSVWVDPEKGLAAILLTNRVNPTRANGAITRVRRAVADLVFEGPP